jgi:adenosylcobinamide-GDP ribazoletransferase
MLGPLVTALRTLTILPIPGKDTDDFSKSLLFFPLAGGIIALVAYPFFLLCHLIPQQLHGVGGLLFTLTSIAITGGLHIDGIADVADGFFGGRNKETILKIMKDSRIGTFGGIAIVMDLLFRFVLYEFIITSLTYVPVLLSMIVSRSAQAIVLSSCSYARGPEGGTAAPFSGSRSKIPLLFVIVTVMYGGFLFFFKPEPLLISLVTVIVTVCGAVWYYYRRIGGITGDCIGSVNEIAEILFLMPWCVCSSISG